MRNNCIYSIECRFSSYFDTDGKHKRKESPGKKRNKPKMAPQFLSTPFRVSETHSAKRARIVDVVFLFFKKTLSFAAFDFIFFVSIHFASFPLDRRFSVLIWIRSIDSCVELDWFSFHRLRSCVCQCLCSWVPIALLIHPVHRSVRSLALSETPRARLFRHLVCCVDFFFKLGLFLIHCR